MGVCEADIDQKICHDCHFANMDGNRRLVVGCAFSGGFYPDESIYVYELIALLTKIRSSCGKIPPRDCPKGINGNKVPVLLSLPL